MEAVETFHLFMEVYTIMDSTLFGVCHLLIAITCWLCYRKVFNRLGDRFVDVGWDREFQFNSVDLAGNQSLWMDIWDWMLEFQNGLVFQGSSSYWRECTCFKSHPHCFDSFSELYISCPTFWVLAASSLPVALEQSHSTFACTMSICFVFFLEEGFIWNSIIL